MSVRFVVVNTFPILDSCQKCANVNARENDNRIIDARWTSAPDISQHASETELFLARNTATCVGVGSSPFPTLFWSF